MKPTEDDLTFFRALPQMDEADLEALMDIATVEDLPAQAELVQDGTRPEHLYFVLEGEMILAKNGRIRRIEPGIFVGELSFVLDDAASATVTMDRGGRVISWSQAELRDLLDRNDAVAAAFDTAFKQDLARKVARS